jgi:hypothetical protein
LSYDSEHRFFTPATLAIGTNHADEIVLVACINDDDTIGAALDRPRATILLNALLDAMTVRGWVQ